MLKRFNGQCKCGECKFLVLNSKPKEIYNNWVFYFSDAQLLWGTDEEKINFANSDKFSLPSATCKSCNSLLPIQRGGAQVFLPTTLLDDEINENFRKQIEAVHPKRRDVRLNVSFESNPELSVSA